ncbi:hypothetical protein FQZ97_974630 [compost metagenome]
MIPALSIRQPWAWLIVNGHKDIENRDWRTPFRGRFLVHASKTITRSYYELEFKLGLWTDHRIDVEALGLPAFEDLQLGGIVGESTVIDCVQDHPSPWKHPESWGFVLANSKPLPFTPYKGRLGFFNVPDGVITP